MAKKNSSLWAYLAVLLAAVVGLAMTPRASAVQNNHKTQAASSSQQDQSGGQSQQAEPSPGEPSGQGGAAESGSASQNQIAATGCLEKTSSGAFHLTDTASMQTYELTAASSSVDLSSEVGHTVTVTGTAAASSAGAAAAPAASAGSAPAPTALTVSKVEMVSSSCTSGE